MHRMRVNDSSSLEEIGYDPIDRELEVKFAASPTKLYRYRNVDSRTYLELLAAKSQGSYFAHRIAKHPDLFPFDRSDVPEEAKGLTLGQSFEAAANLRLALDALEAAVALAQSLGASAEQLAPFRAIERECRK